MKFAISSIVALVSLAIIDRCHGFAGVCTLSHKQQNTCFRMSTVTETDDVALTEKGLLKRDRYVATNRFAVRKGKAAKFEQRWATRKSRLAELQGFKYFQLMRRVTLNNDGSCSYDHGETDDDSFENYVSFTIWNKKSDFSAWRNGDAFKEAHGGTSISAFLSTMVSSALVLRGAPRPAFYDGLLVKSTKPDKMPELVDGWRNVQADGINNLPAESFLQMIKYFVPTGTKAADFESYWVDNMNSLEATPGFVAGSLMRRDGQAKG
jgi:heme-degrading monooxygenase HmoA